MIEVQRFENQMIASVCYLVSCADSGRCVIIDPGSEKSIHEIDFIERRNLNLDYILLTHEHTDHTWGVNALLEKYPQAKVVCSTSCKEALNKEARYFFQYYFDDPEYSFRVSRVDYTTDALGGLIAWDGREIRFYDTPGHCKGSVCIEIEGLLFGGDTLMPYKPYIKKQLGGSVEDYRSSLLFLLNRFDLDTVVYPGHGEKTTLRELLPYYSRILKA